MITVTCSITNTSDKYILVGNGSEIIAAYESKSDAMVDIDKKVPSICDSKWGVVRILAPGESWKCELAANIPKTKIEKLSEAQKDAEFITWMNSLNN